MDGSVFSGKRFETTADGSPTIYLPQLDEHYHSVKGARTESEHIFLNCGLLHAGKSLVRVLEVGFGTGLNAMVSACGGQGKRVEYFSIERYPLSETDIEQAGYYAAFPEPEGRMLRRIHEAEWNCPETITPDFVLTKIECDLTAPDLALPKDIDVVYFDAFAPEKQPEMWEESIFRRIYGAMAAGGILTTYCAKGDIRRRLLSVGFAVERLAGPPGGKREILRAVKTL